MKKSQPKQVQIHPGLISLAVPIDSLLTLDGNPRRGDVAAVMRSLKRFGQRKPIVVRQSDRQITAGNHTFLAAAELGWTQIAALIIDDDMATAHAFALADNRTSELGTTDDDALIALIRSIAEVDPTLLIDSSWDDIAVTELIDRLAKEPELPGDPDAVPSLPLVTITEPGDVWLLGLHRVMCGSATVQADVEHLIAGKRVDMVWTDPPYNVAVDGAAGTIANDDLSASDFADLLRGSMKCAHWALKAGGTIYVAHSETERLAFTAAFLEVGFKLSSTVIWRKSSFTLSRSDYQWQHEPILYGWKTGAAHKWFGDRKTSTIAEFGGDVEQLEDGTWRICIGLTNLIISGDNLKVQEVDTSVVYADKPARNADHPTMKPVALVERMVRNSSKGGGRRFGPVRRVGVDADRVRACRSPGSDHGARPEVRRRHLSALPDVHRHPARPRGHRGASRLPGGR